MSPPHFKLAVFGRPGDTQAALSANDMQRTPKVLVEAINAELGGLSREGTKEAVPAVADKILRWRGLLGPDAGGWYAGPSWAARGECGRVSSASVGCHGA